MAGWTQAQPHGRACAPWSAYGAAAVAPPVATSWVYSAAPTHHHHHHHHHHLIVGSLARATRKPRKQAGKHVADRENPGRGRQPRCHVAAPHRRARKPKLYNATSKNVVVYRVARTGRPCAGAIQYRTR